MSQNDYKNIKLTHDDLIKYNIDQSKINNLQKISRHNLISLFIYVSTEEREKS